MKRIINITLKVATAVLAVALAASCVFEKENPSLVRGKTKVMLELNVGADDMTTKATPSNDEKAIKTLRVYAYIGDVMVGYANPQTISGSWYMDLNLPESGKYDIDFYAVANEGGLSDMTGTSLSANMSKAELKKIMYKATAANTTISSTGIPMYVMHTEEDVDVAVTNGANNVTGHKNHAILARNVKLSLTRSLSKITVYASEEGATTASGIEISGVTVKNVPKTSNLFVAPSTLSAEGLDASAQTALKNPTDGEVAVTELTDSTNYTIESNYTTVTQPYYIAENPNGNEWSNDFNCKTQVENATAVEVSYLLPGDTTSRTGIVYLPKIKRNIHYKVFCRIRANGKAVLDVKAENWDFEELEDIEFTDIVSLQESILWSPEAGYNSTNALYTFGASAGQEATCKFTLATPQNGKWYATIEGKDIQDFVLIKGTTQSSTVSGNIGTSNDMTFTIKTLKDCTIDENLRTVNIRLVAVTSDGKRRFNVNIGSNDHFTIEQKFN